jgi:hypothetical protein
MFSRVEGASYTRLRGESGGPTLRMRAALSYHNIALAASASADHESSDTKESKS